jgi:hypothetical protein
VTGVLSEDLTTAALAAQRLDRERVRAHSMTFGWERAARLFLANITSACNSEPKPLRAYERPAGRSSPSLRKAGGA